MAVLIGLPKFAPADFVGIQRLRAILHQGVPRRTPQIRPCVITSKPANGTTARTCSSFILSQPVQASFFSFVWRQYPGPTDGRDATGDSFCSWFSFVESFGLGRVAGAKPPRGAGQSPASRSAMDVIPHLRLCWPPPWYANFAGHISVRAHGGEGGRAWQRPRPRPPTVFPSLRRGGWRSATCWHARNAA